MTISLKGRKRGNLAREKEEKKFLSLTPRVAFALSHAQIPPPTSATQAINTYLSNETVLTTALRLLTASFA